MQNEWNDSCCGRPRLDLETILSAILFRLREGCSWRALSIFASYTTIYGWWKKWSDSGLWDEIFSEVSEDPAGKLWGIDSTCSKVHKHALSDSQSPDNECIGRTRGGANTKTHALVDVKGRPLRIILSSGKSHDSLFGEALVDGYTDRFILADKAYDSDAFRAWLRENGLEACIPPKANRKIPENYHKGFYKKRHYVENFFQKIKEFRSVATRYEKLDSRFRSFVVLAAIFSWI